jgi:hypothetical protein
MRFPKTHRTNSRLTEFERQSLRLARLGMFVQTGGVIATVGSLIFLALQVQEQVKSTEAQTAATQAQYESIDNSVYQDMMARQLDLNKLFIEKPALHRKLYGKVPAESSKWPSDLGAIADYHLDFFQLIYAQRGRLPALHDPNGAWLTWENTVRAAFENSDALCVRMRENQRMYSSELTGTALGAWCTRTMPTAPRVAR